MIFEVGRYLSLFSAFQCHVSRSQSNANLFQEGIRRRSAGENPNKIIGDLLDLTGNIKDDAAGFEFRGRGVKQYSQLRLFDAFFYALGIARLDAAKLDPVDRKELLCFHVVLRVPWPLPRRCRRRRRQVFAY